MSRAVATVAQSTVTRAIVSLTIGAVCWIAGIEVRRLSLLTYTAAGYTLDAEETATEIVYLSEERNAIREEPSLRLCAEIVGRRMLTSRGVDGMFHVTSTRTGVYTATWRGQGSEIVALDDLVSWALSIGMRARRVGYEVVASNSQPSPGVARTQPRATARSVAS